jgi:transcriptional regulator with XRE-family HTH domain
MDTQAIGTLLRQWRTRRRLSQLDLALEAELSTRHLSFVETGRAQPSRELLLRLGEVLDLPLRERNRLLLTAGFAPHYPEHRLDEPELARAHAAVRQVLDAHAPNPAVAVDRHWNLVLANTTAQRLLAGVAPALLTPPVNVLRLTLHPEGLAPAIINLGEWRRHLLTRLRRLADDSGDPVLLALRQELEAYPRRPGEDDADGWPSPMPDVITLFRLASPAGELRLFSTITVFGTPGDITLAELALELFYPADADTAARLAMLARTDGAAS